MENLYQGKSSKVLDPRSMFVVVGKETIRIWIGSMIPKINVELYKECALNQVKLL